MRKDRGWQKRHLGHKTGKFKKKKKGEEHGNRDLGAGTRLVTRVHFA